MKCQDRFQKRAYVYFQLLNFFFTVIFIFLLLVNISEKLIVFYFFRIEHTINAICVEKKQSSRCSFEPFVPISKETPHNNTGINLQQYVQYQKKKK